VIIGKPGLFLLSDTKRMSSLFANRENLCFAAMSPWIPRFCTIKVSSVAAVILLAAMGCSDSTDSANAPPKKTTQSEVSCHFVIEADVALPERIKVILYFKATSPFDLRELLDSVDMEELLSLHLVEAASVRVDVTTEEKPVDTPPIFGKYFVEQSRVVFTPAFPLLAGETYFVRFQPSAAQRLSLYKLEPITTRHSVPGGPIATRPTLASIFPSASVLPANHLKFYLNFSEPMQRGDIFQYFSLFDLTTSQTVPRPFRHTELWSNDNRRLTLWFHPGRQKTGVNLNVEIGPVLQSDHEYRLIVSGDWQSDRGKELGKDFAKKFRAGRKDAVQPNPKAWKLNSPTATTRDPLLCQLDETLDWALLHSGFIVERIDGDGIRVSGNIEVSENETKWSFTPDSAWTAGKYRLSVQNIIEDLAGNNLSEPFEVDVSKRSSSDANSTSQDDGSTHLEFTVLHALSRESD